MSTPTRVHALSSRTRPWFCAADVRDTEADTVFYQDEQLTRHARSLASFRFEL